ncbi:MAG: nuclease, partial [Burkholderiales bacterium]|nr:nuclease [Burkholderiales bacterium]
RIISIDAPEKGRRGEPGQPYSERSRQHLENLVSGKIVRLSLRGRDDYGRILARIWIEDLDVGLAQVCAGHAWVFDAFLHEL